MGYAMLTAPCYVCGGFFVSNPVRVPSYQNNPICETCIQIANEKRRENGLPEWPVAPDAYQPVDEMELP